jgi:hypothetical protein
MPGLLFLIATLSISGVRAQPLESAPGAPPSAASSDNAAATATGYAASAEFPAPAAGADSKSALLQAPTLILVQGAPGEEVYAEAFSSQIKAWKKAAAKANAGVTTIGTETLNDPAGTVSTPGTSNAPATAIEPRALLEKTLTELPKEGTAEVWIVLIGHGTWDGKEPRFNLEGPDLSATDLAAWLKPVQRPVVVINTSSSSAPFIPVLAGPNRTIITATRSGNERNYAHFGQYLAASLDDTAADYDQDGRISLLEWFLRASSRTAEFYLAEGRILTEHALIDDNGDGKGTPAEWFRGLRATTKAKDKTPVDGARAHQRSLAPDPGSLTMTAAQLAGREKLEAEINGLREKKNTLPVDEYYQKLEDLFRRLADLYAAP